MSVRQQIPGRAALQSLLVVVTLMLTACAGSAPRASAVVDKHDINDNLDAALWMQTAAEYEAAVRGGYNLARVQLDTALADPTWDALPSSERTVPAAGLPPAIITDADETIIDNSPFQSRRVRDNRGFEYPRWLAWVNERRAAALPGAVEFMRFAASKGVKVFFITSRDAPAELEATRRNLIEAGFPVAADGSNLLMRGDARAPDKQKGQRRRWVGEHHRVLLVLGDNLGDFLDDIDTSIAARRALVRENADRWGRQWLMIPNPAYGSWETAILKECAPDIDRTACKRSVLRKD